GIKRMYGDAAEDVFYYLTLYNENHVMPARPADATDEAILGGLYPFSRADGEATATILGSGSIMQQALRAQTILAERFGIAADVWSATSYQLLRNEAMEVERWNRLHPGTEPRIPLVTQVLAEPGSRGPIVAASDYVRAYPDLISRWVPGGAWRSLGTDGFGRSDTREALRRFFEVDAESIAMAVMAELARCGRIEPERAAAAAKELGLDGEAPFSLTH
ncbi:MAG: pyruvate dehydrogenase (acetyl-transferring), homodimeric type, partial [Candidatus Limnocylindrales bacterium]